MPYKSLQHFIKTLEANNELIRVKEYVNPELEITEIVDRYSKSPDGGKALLFENNGTDFPVLINAYGSEKRMCLALGIDNLDTIGANINNIFAEFTEPKKGLLDKLRILPTLSNVASWMPKIVKGKGQCQEIIKKQPDVGILPVLKCWPEDGGKFITLPMVITKDPHTGLRNVGMYRMQLFDKALTGMHWHMHKVGARHFSEYKKLGKKMPIAIALGGDPAYTYSATAPLPDNVDEYLFAGFLRKKRVQLVKCITQDIEVPSDADIIIEGFVDTEEEFILEGPFGDHTGFYSLADMFPKFHITCITHRKNAVYPATIVGIPPMEDAWIGKATERIFLTPIKISMLPEIIDFDLPFVGVAHNLAIVKIKKTYPGQAIKVMNSLWGAGQMMFNKVLIIVDQDVDIHNYNEIGKIINKNVDIPTDLHFSMGPLDILDHSSSKYAFGSKLGIDATTKFREEITEHKNITTNPNDILDKEMLIKEFPEITDFNYFGDLLKLSIISIDKKKTSNLAELSQRLVVNKSFIDNVSISIFVDQETDINDFNMVAWLTLGNIDPKRDSFLIPDEKGMALFIDGTRKALKTDKFDRDWPNIIVSDDTTIASIDKKWEMLGLGDFIQSPSIKYKKMHFKGGAKVAE
ncbi:MAG: menaquinone biosynthesis decarboxylase [Bacteroidetes bacterium GWF2_33_16]|nr:MAG: menaquinone biosynthesis decarboxylase [Bacteroidetes bacterium GWE2_32_14]OFY08886.1 MAG: menaquinone biosynthesis decarboxylase [Bacteroidetes bacterium GWF2_33_16]